MPFIEVPSAGRGMGVAVSAAEAQWTLKMAMPASPRAMLDCVNAFAATDFRQDLRAVRVPALVIHGDGDQTVPIASSGERTAQMLSHAQYVVYPGAPHGLHLLSKDGSMRTCWHLLHGQCQQTRSGPERKAPA